MPGLNGVFFNQPTADSLISAIEHSEVIPWESAAIRAHAEKWDVPIFQRNFTGLFHQLVDRHFSAPAAAKARELETLTA